MKFNFAITCDLKIRFEWFSVSQRSGLLREETFWPEVIGLNGYDTREWIPLSLGRLKEQNDENYEVYIVFFSQ
jgi:hypothetical protein